MYASFDLLSLHNRKNREKKTLLPVIEKRTIYNVFIDSFIDSFIDFLKKLRDVITERKYGGLRKDRPPLQISASAYMSFKGLHSYFKIKKNQKSCHVFRGVFADFAY